MRIGGEPQLLIFVANLRPPDRGEGQEEALLRCQAVDLFVAFLRVFVERLLQRGISELYSSDIRDVFALREFAVHMLARQRRVRGVLIDNCFTALVVLVRRFLGPPIA